VPINELLTNFVLEQSGARELAKLKCSECGMTFLEFRSSGLFGCPGDYDAFAKALGPLLEKTHEGATQHVGKAPRRGDDAQKKQRDLMRMRRELADLIEQEKYEAAAVLRDKIKAMEE
jgi:protein arginine kinase activator